MWMLFRPMLPFTERFSHRTNGPLLPFDRRWREPEREFDDDSKMDSPY